MCVVRPILISMKNILKTKHTEANMLRIVALSSILASAFAQMAVNPGPGESINVAFESETADPVETRRAADEARFESRVLSRMSNAHAANTNLAAMLAVEKQHSSFLKAPVVELSLSSPVSPHAQVSAAVAGAEGRRDAMTSQKMKSLLMAFTAVKSKAMAQLSAVLSGKASFAHFNSMEPTVRATLVPGAADEIAGKSELDALESKRSNSEAALFDQASAEFSEVANVIVNAFARRLNKRASFLGGAGFNKEVNVRLMGNGDYPTISNLVAGMESRRDLVEDNVRATVLDLEAQLVKSLIALGEQSAR